MNVFFFWYILLQFFFLPSFRIIFEILFPHFFVFFFCFVFFFPPVKISSTRDKTKEKAIHENIRTIYVTFVKKKFLSFQKQAKGRTFFLPAKEFLFFRGCYFYSAPLPVHFPSFQFFSFFLVGEECRRVGGEGEGCKGLFCIFPSPRHFVNELLYFILYFFLSFVRLGLLDVDGRTRILFSENAFFRQRSKNVAAFLAIFRNERTTILTPSTSEEGEWGRCHVFRFESP